MESCDLVEIESGNVESETMLGCVSKIVISSEDELGLVACVPVMCVRISFHVLLYTGVYGELDIESGFVVYIDLIFWADSGFIEVPVNKGSTWFVDLIFLNLDVATPLIDSWYVVLFVRTSKDCDGLFSRKKNYV